jgi:hypothetical protein
MSYNICVSHHPNHFLAFDVHTCELQPSSFWAQDLQNYKQLMPLVHPKRVDNYKMSNNAPKFHYQHCINIYNLSYYTWGSRQLTHDLSNQFIIDLLIICHFSFIDSINLPKKCDNHVLVKQLWCSSTCKCLHSCVNIQLIFYVLPWKYHWK